MQILSHNKVITLAICVVLAALTWVVFGQTRAYPFINYDDPGYVAENSDVAGGLSAENVKWAFTHVHGANWHPLTTISHMLDARFFGLNAGRHHLVNVFLHALAVILLFLVLRAMTGSLWRSAFVAAVFAIHPLRAESVAWISERKDVLSAVFFMLTLGAYLRYVRKPSVGRYLLIAILFALGLMSKPMLVTLPVILLLLDYWPLGRSLRRSDVSGQRSAGRSWSELVIEKLPLFILSAASGVATILAQKQALGSVETLPLSWRLTNAMVSCVTYIRQMFWPARLALFYPHPEDRLPIWELVAATTIIVALTVAAFVWRKRYPYVLTGWLWYLIMLGPVLGIVQVGLQGHADRFTYLPQIGLYLLIAWGLHDLLAGWRYRRQILSVAGVIVIALLAWRARIQTFYWRDSELLWAHTLAVTSDNDVAHTNLSEIFVRRKRMGEAIHQAEAALKIRPDNPQAFNNLGAAYMRTGRMSAAAWYLRKSLELQPEGLNASSSLAWILATAPDGTLRDGAQAVKLAEFAAAKGGRSNPLLLHTLAAAYAEAGRFVEAVGVAEEALRLARAQGNAALITELELNLGNYQKHLPLRDPGPPPSEEPVPQ